MPDHHRSEIKNSCLKRIHWTNPTIQLFMIQSDDPDQINNAPGSTFLMLDLWFDRRNIVSGVSGHTQREAHTFNLPHSGSARASRMFVAIALSSASVLVTCSLLIGCRGGESHQSGVVDWAVLIALLGSLCWVIPTDCSSVLSGWRLGQASRPAAGGWWLLSVF